jgi:hypothetical protein
MDLSPLPLGGVRFRDPDGVHRTPEIGEGGPQPAPSSAGAGRLRGSEEGRRTIGEFEGATLAIPTFRGSRYHL